MADPNNTAGRPNVAAATTDLEQFLVTYTSNTTSNPKFVDSSGNAVGTRLDGNGDFKGYSTSVAGAIVTTAIQVPEPGMLLLAGAALAALALSRRAARRG
jgi:hypothetical protein